MPEVDLAAEVFLRNLVHASDIRFRGRCRAPANLGTEAEKVVAAVGIARHVWILADHEPNVNLVGVVRVCRYIQNFTISYSSFLAVDVLIYAYELWGWCASGNGVVLGMISWEQSPRKGSAPGNDFLGTIS